MTKQRKHFDPSFKLEVVRMIKEQGLSVTHVSQSMHIGPTAIRRWLQQYEAEQSGQRGIRVGRVWQMLAQLITNRGQEVQRQTGFRQLQQNLLRSRNLAQSP